MIENKMIWVTNCRDKIEVEIITDEVQETRYVYFVAYDTNEWVAVDGRPIQPEDPVNAVLQQIYLHCRNLAPLKWISETKYTLDAEDKFFEPLWVWMGNMEDREDQG